MYRLTWLMGLALVAGHLEAQSTPPTPTLVRSWEFSGVRPAAFDSGMAEFRAFLGTRGYFGYSYYAGDDGRRYLGASISGLGDLQTQDSITAATVRAMPNREAFLERWTATWGSVDEAVWESMPELSSPPTGMTGAEVNAKYPFRRVTVRYVRPDREAAFEAAIREARAVDARIGSGIPMAVSKMVVGAGQPAYRFSQYAESSKAYWELTEARRVKREADPAWAGIARRISDAQREVMNVSLTRNPALSYSRP